MSIEYKFIDFGAGKGGSFNFACECTDGIGLAIDKSNEAILECQRLGYPAECHDVLKFSGRNLVQAAFAIDLMHELPGQQAFRTALINIIRSATHYAVIQHPLYDHDAKCAIDGYVVEDHYNKKTLFKPTVADYLHFVSSYKDSLSIVGCAAYAWGEAQATASVFSGADTGNVVTIPRTLRIIVGRKALSRFRLGQFRAAVGKPLFSIEDQVEY